MMNSGDQGGLKNANLRGRRAPGEPYLTDDAVLLLRKGETICNTKKAMKSLRSFFDIDL